MVGPTSGNRPEPHDSSQNTSQNTQGKAEVKQGFFSKIFSSFKATDSTDSKISGTFRENQENSDPQLLAMTSWMKDTMHNIESLKGTVQAVRMANGDTSMLLGSIRLMSEQVKTEFEKVPQDNLLMQKNFGSMLRDLSDLEQNCQMAANAETIAETASPVPPLATSPVDPVVKAKVEDAAGVILSAEAQIQKNTPAITGPVQEKAMRQNSSPAKSDPESKFIKLHLELEQLEKEKPVTSFVDAPDAFEPWLRRYSACLADNRDVLLKLLEDSGGKNKNIYKTALEDVTEKKSYCDQKANELFSALIELEKVRNYARGKQIGEIFKEVQGVLGKGIPLSPMTKLSLLASFKNEEMLVQFEGWLDKVKTQKAMTRELVQQGDYPRQADLTIEFLKFIVECGPMQLSSELSNDWSDGVMELKNMLLTKVGIEQNTQPFVDSIALAVKTEEDVMKGPEGYIGIRYLTPLIRNRTYPQVFSPTQERELLERQKFKSIVAGTLCRVDWKTLANGDAELTYTIRVSGSRAKEVGPQSFTALLPFSKVPQMDKFAVAEFVRHFYDARQKDASLETMEKKDLRLLSKEMQMKVLNDQKFWDWVNSKDPMPDANMEEKKTQALATLKALIDLAQDFQTDTLKKLVGVNVLLGE